MFGALQGQLCIIQKLSEGWRPLTPQARGGQAPIREPVVAVPGPADDWEAQLFPPFPFRCIDCGCSLELSICHDRDVNRPLIDCMEPLDTSGPVDALEPSAKARRLGTEVIAASIEDLSDQESTIAPVVPLEFDS